MNYPYTYTARRVIFLRQLSLRPFAWDGQFSIEELMQTRIYPTLWLEMTTWVFSLGTPFKIQGTPTLARCPVDHLARRVFRSVAMTAAPFFDC